MHFYKPTKLGWPLPHLWEFPLSYKRMQSCLHQLSCTDTSSVNIVVCVFIPKYAWIHIHASSSQHSWSHKHEKESKFIKTSKGEQRFFCSNTQEVLSSMVSENKVPTVGLRNCWWMPAELANPHGAAQISHLWTSLQNECNQPGGSQEQTPTPVSPTKSMQ